MIKKPYLIQRAIIKRPLAKPNEVLSAALSFDYMGSAEFEFGALGRSLRRMELNQSRQCRIQIQDIQQNGVGLRILHHFNDAQWIEYKKYILLLRKDQIRLKESSGFNQPQSSSLYGNINCWWDIENDILWSFEKTFMKRLPDYLNSSWIKMSAMVFSDTKIEE